jgi:hypothetical protein
MEFIPAYSNGQEPFGSSYVSNAAYYPGVTPTSAADFAICKLYTSLGTNIGYMGNVAYYSDTSYTNGTVTFGDVIYDPGSLSGEIPVFNDVSVLNVVDNGNAKLLESIPINLENGGSGILWTDDSTYGDAVAGVFSGLEQTSGGAEDAGWAGGPLMVTLISWGWTNY